MRWLKSGVVVILLIASIFILGFKKSEQTEVFDHVIQTAMNQMEKALKGVEALPTPGQPEIQNDQTSFSISSTQPAEKLDSKTLHSKASLVSEPQTELTQSQIKVSEQKAIKTSKVASQSTPEKLTQPEKTLKKLEKRKKVLKSALIQVYREKNQRNRDGKKPLTARETKNFYKEIEEAFSVSFDSLDEFASNDQVIEMGENFFDSKGDSWNEDEFITDDQIISQLSEKQLSDQEIKIVKNLIQTEAKILRAKNPDLPASSLFARVGAKIKAFYLSLVHPTPTHQNPVYVGAKERNKILDRVIQSQMVEMKRQQSFLNKLMRGLKRLYARIKTKLFGEIPTANVAKKPEIKVKKTPLKKATVKAKKIKKLKKKKLPPIHFTKSKWKKQKKVSLYPSRRDGKKLYRAKDEFYAEPSLEEFKDHDGVDEFFQ